MNQDQALNQEETEEDLFMPELMDNMEEGENNELISLSASELINTTDGEKFGLEGPSGSVLEHIMVDCDDFYLLEEKGNFSSDSESTKMERVPMNGQND